MNSELTDSCVQEFDINPNEMFEKKEMTYYSSPQELKLLNQRSMDCAFTESIGEVDKMGFNQDRFDQHIVFWKLYKLENDRFIELEGFHDIISQIANWKADLNESDYADDGYIDHSYSFTVTQDLIE